MAYEILSVTFDLDTHQNHAGNFCLPRQICDFLDLKPRQNATLSIYSLDGSNLFEGVQQIRPGYKIYGPAMTQCIQAGQRVRITLSRLDVGHEHENEVDLPERPTGSLEDRVAALERIIKTLSAPTSAVSADNATEPVERAEDVEEFADDDDCYLRWIKDHPDGFVVNSFRNPAPEYMVLHRAMCRSISSAVGMTEPGGFTERRYIKICSLSKDALTDWTRQNGRPDGSSSSYCGGCKP